MNRRSPPRHRFARWSSVAYLMALLSVVAAHAGARCGPIEVDVMNSARSSSTSHAVQSTSHGYSEYVVNLRNHGESDKDVQLTLQSTPYWGGEQPISVRRIVVPKEQTLAVSIFQTPVYSDNPVVRVKVAGVENPVTLSVNSPLTSMLARYSGSREPIILVTPSSPKLIIDSLNSSAIVLINEMPMKQWNTDWLGYSSYDAIILADKDIETAPPEVQNTLRRYVECGGTIYFRGKNLPARWLEGAAKENDKRYLIGLGKINLVGSSWGAAWILPTDKFTPTDVYAYVPDEIPNHPEGLLIEKGSVPVRGMFVLVVLFGIGIGPVNLFLLSWTNRRIWLWWNVPLIALLTCGLIFGYALVSDGVSNRALAASMTVLDQPRHRATTFGYCSYYCPFTPSSGPLCTLDTDIKLLDPPSELYSHRIDTTPKITDWTVEQQLTTGWIQARVPTYFQFRQVRDRRERLTVEVSSDGTYTVVNALGANIKRLYLAKDNGDVIEATAIAAGAKRSLDSKAILRPLQAPTGEQKPKFKQSAAQNIFRQTYWLPAFRSWNEGQMDPDRLAPGCYVAFLDASPFVEQTLMGASPRDSVAIVYGIYKD